MIEAKINPRIECTLDFETIEELLSYSRTSNNYIGVLYQDPFRGPMKVFLHNQGPQKGVLMNLQNVYSSEIVLSEVKQIYIFDKRNDLLTWLKD